MHYVKILKSLLDEIYMTGSVQKYLHKLYRVSIFTLLVHIAPVSAQISIDLPTTFAGFSSQDLKDTIENIVRIIIGFLGILVIVAILYGGFKMMTSRGDADEMGKGRQIVVAGAIGLIIVLAAYAISIFVINSLVAAV